MINKDPDEVVMKFIEERITCVLPDEQRSPELHDLVKQFQSHRCGPGCLRKGTFLVLRRS